MSEDNNGLLTVDATAAGSQKYNGLVKEIEETKGVPAVQPRSIFSLKSK